MKARQFQRPGERMMVIFTRGGRFVVNDDHSGSTGNWVIDPNRNVDRVVIYHRRDQASPNELYIGTFKGVQPTDKPTRYSVQLDHIQYVGLTESNWLDFADGGQNPIRYLE